MRSLGVFGESGMPACGDLPQVSSYIDVEALDCCMTRTPVVGDGVMFKTGEASSLKDERGTPDAWRCASGDVLRVVAVDEDGDFRLRNAAGIVSAWTYRKNYNYALQADRQEPPSPPPARRPVCK